jgi:hypothetical protein
LYYGLEFHIALDLEFSCGLKYRTWQEWLRGAATLLQTESSRLPGVEAGVSNPTPSRVYTGILSLLGQLARSWRLRLGEGGVGVRAGPGGARPWGSGDDCQAIWRSVAESTVRLLEVSLQN